MDKELTQLLNEISKLTREDRHNMLLELEKDLDIGLVYGMIDQETAWDGYFSLLHECDESRFTEDRPRILSKIDTVKYNPFKSKNPEILMLARIRLGSGEEPGKKETLN